MKTINIAGIKFEIIPLETESSDLDDNSEALFGLCDSTKRKIYINYNEHGADLDMLRRTLFHEVLHGVLAVSGWHDLLAQLGDDAEEGLVQCLEHLLYPTINDIKKFSFKDNSKKGVLRVKTGD